MSSDRYLRPGQTFTFQEETFLTLHAIGEGANWRCLCLDDGHPLDLPKWVLEMLGRMDSDREAKEGA